MQPLSPPASPSETSSTPTSSTVVAAVGCMSSRNRASFRLRERSEIASASRTGRDLRMDHDGRAEREPREHAQRLVGGMEAPALAGAPIARRSRRAAVDREPVAARPARRQPRLGPREDDDAAAEAPPPARDLVGDVEPADRGRRVRSRRSRRAAGRRPGRPRGASAAASERSASTAKRTAAGATARRARHPADDAVPEHVALDGEPVAATLRRPAAAAPSRTASSSPRRRASGSPEHGGSRPSPRARSTSESPGGGGGWQRSGARGSRRHSAAHAARGSKWTSRARDTGRASVPPE